ELYSEYSENDEFYSRFEDGVLKLKTGQGNSKCQRATHYWYQDLSYIKGFQLCLHINHLVLPKGLKLQLYISLGEWELYATVEKRDIKNKTLLIRLDDRGTYCNLKGALNGKIGRR